MTKLIASLCYLQQGHVHVSVIPTHVIIMIYQKEIHMVVTSGYDFISYFARHLRITLLWRLSTYSIFARHVWARTGNHHARRFHLCFQDQMP